MVWAYSLISVFVVSLISLIGAFTLFLKDRYLKKILLVLVSLSVGALFGDAFIHLIPEVFESGVSPLIISGSILGGIILFFVMEKFLRWRHSHGIDEESQDSLYGHDHDKKHIGTLVIVADGVHNFIDGVIIAASFLVSTEVGIATTIAVILHEIPQEIGDFGLLLHAGWSKKKALFFNLISALCAVLGAILVLVLGGENELFMVIVSALAAGGFVYIAGSDLVPELHKTKALRASLVQFSAIILGLVLMFALVFLE